VAAGPALTSAVGARVAGAGGSAGSLRFWLTHLMLVQLGILLVWLANGSGGSILLAVLAHAGFNVTVGLAPSGLPFDMVALLALTGTVSAVVTATRGRLCFLPDDDADRPSSPRRAGRDRRRVVRTRELHGQPASSTGTTRRTAPIPPGRNGVIRIP
jgi:hypothetical protein